jgi:poly-beta-hydroxybutyrate-responsive repressor
MARAHTLPMHFLRRCLLLLLAERADYGYDLVERLEAFGFDGSDPGGVYRALRMMERQALVRSAWLPSGVGPYRRVYELTAAGREALCRGVADIEDSNALLERFLARYALLPGADSLLGPGPAPAHS